MNRESSVRSQYEAGEVIHLANLPTIESQYVSPDGGEDAVWASMPARGTAAAVFDFVTRAENIYGPSTVRTGNALNPETKQATGVGGEVGVYVDATAFWGVARRLIADDKR